MLKKNDDDDCERRKEGRNGPYADVRPLPSEGPSPKPSRISLRVLFRILRPLPLSPRIVGSFSFRACLPFLSLCL